MEFREIGLDSHKSQTDEKNSERMEKIAKEASHGLDMIYTGVATLVTLGFTIQKIRKLMRMCKDSRMDILNSRLEKLQSKMEDVDRKRKRGAISKEEADRKTITLIKKIEFVLVQLAQSKEEKLEIKEKFNRRLNKLERRLT